MFWWFSSYFNGEFIFNKYPKHLDAYDWKRVFGWLDKDGSTKCYNSVSKFWCVSDPGPYWRKMDWSLWWQDYSGLTELLLLFLFPNTTNTASKFLYVIACRTCRRSVPSIGVVTIMSNSVSTKVMTEYMTLDCACKRTNLCGWFNQLGFKSFAELSWLNI